jgi:NADPH:quinone reductase-like Zn-dependent oxidoreductase
MQASRAVGIGMSERHSDQIVPFKINDVSAQFFGNHKTIGKLTGETCIPKRRERDEITAMFDQLAPLVASGTILTPVVATYGFERVAEAIAKAGESRGKVLFTPRT